MFGTIAATVLPLVASILKTTLLKDKPNAIAATDLAVDLAIKGVMGVDRFNAFAKKVIELPPGTDFTVDELIAMRALSQDASDEFDKVFEALKPEE